MAEPSNETPEVAANHATKLGAAIPLDNRRLPLITSNPTRYAPFARQLELLRIQVQPPREPLPEIQGLDFSEVLAAKARSAAAMFGRPVLVDEAGLLLEAYQPFPGPLTSAVLRGLGVPGLQRLLASVSKRAAMETHIGCWIAGKLRSWSGAVQGELDLTRLVRDPRMMLSDLFIPEAPGESGTLIHRARALAAIGADIFELHLDMGRELAEPACAPPNTPPVTSGFECPFCLEFEEPGTSIFADMLKTRLATRVVYEDDDFVVMPPLGEFMEGGLLLLTREHLPSFAYLAPERFERLERLIGAICRTLEKEYGVAPLVFEHGPSPARGKGICCVDHAHLNIFPARVQVQSHLAPRMSLAIASLSGLARLRRAEFGYLFVQENSGARRAYDGQDVPTQLVRRIITTQIGLPDRWHWRDYPGVDELVATFKTLKDKIRL